MESIVVARDFPLGDPAGGGTSRCSLLQAMSVAPVAADPVSVTWPWSVALASLHHDYGDEPITIMRTKQGRSLSRHRYHVAEGFFPKPELAMRASWHDYLHTAGIAAQLALSSHLLDVGFPDDWNARHIGLRVAKSLAYANATGFGHECKDMARLAEVLTPYWKWNQVHLFGKLEPDDGGFTPAQIGSLLRILMDRVHDVTGHSRPNGWRRDRGGTRA